MSTRTAYKVFPIKSRIHLEKKGKERIENRKQNERGIREKKKRKKGKRSAWPLIHCHPPTRWPLTTWHLQIGKPEVPNFVRHHPFVTQYTHIFSHLT